ncbi:hypothetical protein ACHQM5_017729 [Ranunculus cassubicifolius]
MNDALLAKWIWLVARDTNNLWARVVKEKFGMEKGGWFTKCPKGGYRCSLWRGIMRQKSKIEENSCFRVGRDFLTTANKGIEDNTTIGEGLRLFKEKGETILSQQYWKWVFHAVSWAIWKERNRRVFEEKKAKAREVQEIAKKMIWEWGLESKEGRLIRMEEVLYQWNSIVS